MLQMTVMMMMQQVGSWGQHMLGRRICVYPVGGMIVGSMIAHRAKSSSLQRVVFGEGSLGPA